MKFYRRPTLWLMAGLISCACLLPEAYAQQSADSPEASQATPQKSLEPSGLDSAKPGPTGTGAKPRPRIGVAMTTVPEITSQVPGASCLLCIATAHSTMSTLKEHLGKLSTEDLVKLKAEVADILKKQDVDVVLIAEALDLNSLPDVGKRVVMHATKDFSSIKEKYKLDKLAVIEILRVGVIRDFSGYLPRGDPKALLNGSSYLVNLTTNAYESLTRLHIMKACEGPWDEPPMFPGMTNAYFQTIEMARDQVLEEWRRGSQQ